MTMKAVINRHRTEATEEDYPKETNFEYLENDSRFDRTVSCVIHISDSVVSFER